MRMIIHLIVILFIIKSLVFFDKLNEQKSSFGGERLSDANWMFFDIEPVFHPLLQKKMDLKSTSHTALRLRSHLEAEKKVNS